MKALPFFFVLFSLCANETLAQSEPVNFTEEQEANISENVDFFSLSLNLTKVQEKEYEAICRKYAKKLIAVRDSDDAKIWKYRKLKSIQGAQQKDMKQLLSEEQYPTYLKLQEERQEEKRKKAKQN